MNPSSTPKQAERAGKGGMETSHGGTEGTNRLVDLGLCAWFVLVGVAFWGPYAGFALPFNILSALYAAFLLVFIAHAALAFLRHQPVPVDVKGERRGK